ncbi:MAG: hypothetical protein DWQ31_20575 [Planctomycetota bacterium]|nr:MAG: hypothetical protein DWQ31_20575 [Planctomycetota bacterium]REJ96684.1 MAG: hypothetical protein DWQ35_03700 [Planctomycetota bacterium]REK22285.1 MAG: hypothetical protein DWQ42_17240 [Planctomycetota bacterium]REK41085.1 MAG: hypothetical protein DWQ46_14685 [Planctomycetota bacterium]
MQPHDPKPRPNHQRYLAVLRSMTPEERLRKAWELTETARMLMREGIRHRHPDLSEAEVHEIYLREMARCHNSGS